MADGFHGWLGRVGGVAVIDVVLTVAAAYLISHFARPYAPLSFLGTLVVLMWLAVAAHAVFVPGGTALLPGTSSVNASLGIASGLTLIYLLSSLLSSSSGTN